MTQYLKDPDFLSLFDESASHGTIRTYASIYAAILSYFEIPSLYVLFDKFDYDDIEEYLLNMPKGNTAKAYLSLIKKLFDKDEIPDELNQLHDTLNELIIKQKKVHNEALIKKLPKYETVRAKLRQVKDPLSYIINFLIITLNCRNMDLYCKIVYSAKQAKDKSFNYLLVGRSTITFIRNVYKTAEVYGEKMNKFSNVKLREAVAQYAKGEEKFLFQNKDGNPIPLTALASLIPRKTIDGLSESEFFKIYVDFIDRTGNLNMLRRASKNRGTSISRIVESYHMKIKL